MSDDRGWEVAVDPAGHAYVTGTTLSLEFPTTPGAFDRTHNGAEDAFVTRVRPDGSALGYSTFLGGESIDEGFSIGVRTGHAYVIGNSHSPDFPTTPGAFDTSFNGGADAFVTKFLIGDKTTR